MRHGKNLLSVLRAALMVLGVVHGGESVLAAASPVAEVKLTASKTSPQKLSSAGTVVFTVVASGGSGSYEYKFFLRAGAGAYLPVGDTSTEYSAANSWSWTPTVASSYTVLAYARNLGSAAPYEKYATMSYTIQVDPPTTGVTLTPDKISPQPASTTITFTAQASGGTGSYTYRFFVAYGSGPFVAMENGGTTGYSSDNQFSWTTNTSGSYKIRVYAKNTSSLASYQSTRTVSYTIMRLLYCPSEQAVLGLSPKGDVICGAAIGPKGEQGEQGIPGLQGPKGDKGDQGIQGIQGAKGDRGYPGNLALAGKVCPDGMYLTGFDEIGDIICSAIKGGAAQNFQITTIISSANIVKTRIAVGSDGKPVVGYNDSTDLRVLKCEDVACVSNNIISSIGSNSNNSNNLDSFDLAIGTDGLPKIAARILIGYSNSVSQLQFIACGNAACSSGNISSTIDAAGGPSGGGIDGSLFLGIGIDGLPAVSYVRNSSNTNKSLNILKCGNDSCTSNNVIMPIETITDADTSLQIYAFNVAQDNMPIGVYHVRQWYDYPPYNSYERRLIKCGNESCSSGNVTRVWPYTESSLDVGVGNDGIPVMSYYDATNRDLQVIKCNDISCESMQAMTADPNGDVGDGNAIAITKNGYPFIAYYDSITADLKMIRCGSVDCSSGNVIKTVDSGVVSRNGISIAVGSDDLAVISYVADGGLKIAKENQ